MFLKLPKIYNLDELLCVRFGRTIDNAGVFSINNSKFQIIDENSLDYHQWLPKAVLELINEFYLKDTKAS